jgi:hypothetical protein
MFLRTDEIDYSSERSQGRRGNPRKQLRLTPGFGNVGSAAGYQLAHPMCRACLLPVFSTRAQKTDRNVIRPRIELYLCAFAAG